MSKHRDSQSPRRTPAKTTVGTDEDDAPIGQLDTEGSGAHLVEVMAHNTLKDIIQTAKEIVILEMGSFRIPSYVMDRLVIKCEKVLLNYGEEEAHRTMVEDIKAHLALMKQVKERDNERKVKERLPSSGTTSDSDERDLKPQSGSHRRG